MRMWRCKSCRSIPRPGAVLCSMTYYARWGTTMPALLTAIILQIDAIRIRWSARHSCGAMHVRSALRQAQAATHGASQPHSQQNPNGTPFGTETIYPPNLCAFDLLKNGQKNTLDIRGQAGVFPAICPNNAKMALGWPELILATCVCGAISLFAVFGVSTVPFLHRLTAVEYVPWLGVVKERIPPSRAAADVIPRAILVRLWTLPTHRLSHSSGRVTLARQKVGGLAPPFFFGGGGADSRSSLSTQDTSWSIG